jgi:DNA-binding transcriptional regulator PaaX
MAKRPDFDIKAMIDGLPAGLDRALLRILSYHSGRQNAIGRGELVANLRRHGFHVSERAMRAQISQLRKAGYLIGSAPGSDGGYYLIQSAQEFDEFVRMEYRAKIADMSETLRAMQKAADSRWGPAAPAQQTTLF